MKIGVQIYTLREHIATVAELDATFEKLAKIGYDGIEVPGVNYGLDYVKQTAQKHSLLVPATHTHPERILQDTISVIEEHKSLGAKYIGLPMMGFRYLFSKEGLQDFIKDYKPVAKKIKDAGLRFMYHNHHVEMERYDNKTIMQHLAEAFSSEEMGFEIDTYWIQAGGGCPAKYIEKLADRVECVHFKDMRMDFSNKAMDGTNAKDCPVMTGNLNWDAIITACKAANVEWIFVEQDNTHGQDPFEAVKISYDNLKGRI